MAGEIVHGPVGTAHGGGDAVDIDQFADREAPPPGGGYSEPPEWLGPIESRMAELEAQNWELADALQQQQGYGHEAYDDEYDPDFEPTDEDWAELGIDPAEVAEIEQQAQQPDGLDSTERDIVDLFDTALNRRVSAMEAQDEIQDRDELYEGLKEKYEFMQREEVAAPVVRRAQRLAESLDPEIVNTVGFVDLIEAVCKTMLVEQAAGEPDWTQPQRQPRSVELEAANGATVHHQRAPEVDFQALIVQRAAEMRPKI